MVNKQITLKAWSKNENLASIKVNKGDVLSRNLEIDITDSEGKYIDFTNKKVNIHFQKPDNTVSYIPAEIIESGKIKITLTSQVASVSGLVTCSVQIISSNPKETLIVSRFLINVLDNNIEESVVSSNEFSALTEALEKADDIEDEINAIKSTTINGKPLSKNVTLEAIDIEGYRPLGNGYDAPMTVQSYLVALDDEKVPATRKINSKALSSDVTLSATDVQAVPNTRKVNGVSLGSDATLTAANIHAYNKPAWLNLVYPVGSIYMSMVSTNPNTLFGTGSWKQIAQGRTLIGIDSSDGDFNSVGKTGGSKTKTLSVNEMPQVNVLSKTDAYLYTTKGNRIAEIGGLTKGSAFEEDNTRGGMRRNPPDVELITEGGNQPFSIMPPYITCYIWQRTA